METLKIQEISRGYRSTFVENKDSIIEIPVCPEGFKRAFLGKKLQVPVLISDRKYSSDKELDSIDTGVSPFMKYGDFIVDGVMQRQPDGRVIYVWVRENN